MKRCTLLAAAVLASLGLAAQAMPSMQGTALRGEVLEVLSVPTYTYLRLKTKEGEVWAAVPVASVKKGDQVVLVNAQPVERFESKTLKRKFDRILFATLAPTGKQPAGHGVAPTASRPVAKLERARAADAKTVAEVVAGPAPLNGKTVTIRGQVVKVSSGIMGKNWIHLQDGSGSAAKGTHDIVVTTKDTTAVGDVINASGTVRTDVNLGSGYVYAVLVENAKIRR
jgi:hypothetical protein